MTIELNNHIYKFTTSIRDGTWVRHRRSSGLGPTLPNFRISTDRARREVLGWVRHRKLADSLVPCTGSAGMTVLWFLARPVRAQPFSGCQQGERGLEKERYAARGSVAWKRNATLLQVKEEEEEDRQEKRREILIGADQDQDLFFFVATLSCFQTRSFVSSFLSLGLLRKPNREAKAWRRWWC